MENHAKTPSNNAANKTNVKQTTHTASASPSTHAPNTQPQAADLNAKITELTADLQRTRADFENYRKQMDLQKAQAADYAKQSTVKKVLPLLDNLDRAIAMTPDLKPLEKSFEKVLKELKLEKIDSRPDAPFNPDYHDAISMEEGDGKTEVIAETLLPGYLYEGEVLRPAMVKVKML